MPKVFPPVTTNDLVKGDNVILADTLWRATIADNARGNIRTATVYGFETETGSVYSHDIVYYVAPDGAIYPITHTDKQIALRKEVNNLFAAVSAGI